MKQLLVTLLFLCVAGVAQAQDVIVKKDGSTIVCRVVELNKSEIVYKKWAQLNGSNYVMERSAASAINYENGKKVDLAEAENLYQPGNQNDGTQQYNDRALLAIDAAAINPYKKAKNLRTIGWVGGGILAVAAVFICTNADGQFGNGDYYYLGGACGIGAIAWTTSFLLAAHHQKKKVQMLESSTIYQYDLLLSAKHSLPNKN